MEKDSWIGAAFHYFDKNIGDPKAYILAPETKKLSKNILKFNPLSSDYKPFSPDNDSLSLLSRVFERQTKLLRYIEPCIKPNVSQEVESILQQLDENILSPNLNAIVLGYLTTTLNKKIEQLADLQKITNQGDQVIAPSAINNEQLKKNKEHAEENQQLIAHLLNASSFEQFIENRNITYWEKLFNYGRKNFNVIGYITHPDSLVISEGILHFHPEHTSGWKINSSLPTHVQAVHMAIEREKALLYTLEKYIKLNKHAPIIDLKENAAKGYFSKAAIAVMDGYLEFIAREKQSQYHSSEKIHKQSLSSSMIEHSFACEIHESHIDNLCKTAIEFDKENIVEIKHEAQNGKGDLKKVKLFITAKKTESGAALVNTLTKTLEVLANNSKEPVDSEKNNENKLNEEQNVKAKNAASDHSLKENQFESIKKEIKS